MKCIIGGKIITETEILNNHVIIFDENINAILPEKDADISDMEIIDARGNYVCPGFISTHIHGCMNCDTEDASYDNLNTISEHLLNTGVTSWCPTLCTVDIATFNKVLDTVRKAKEESSFS